MTNHMHLAVQAGNMPLSRGMQNLAFRYTRWINDRDGRTGHLFQGLCKALLGDGDSYLLELVRYLPLNPVRAGVVNDPLDSPWSGHRAVSGERGAYPAYDRLGAGAIRRKPQEGERGVGRLRSGWPG